MFYIPKGANVNAAKLHETALHHAAKMKNVDLIELLVEFGGNVYARDNLKRKPIHYTSLGSPSYLCLDFYESEFPVEGVHFSPSPFNTPLKANVSCFSLRRRHPPQSAANQQSGREEIRWEESWRSSVPAGPARSHHTLPLLHASSDF